MPLVITLLVWFAVWGSYGAYCLGEGSMCAAVCRERGQPESRVVNNKCQCAPATKWSKP